MKKIFIRVGLLMSISASIMWSPAQAQVYYTKEGTGAFSVSAPAKTINASSRYVSIELDKAEARLLLSVPVASFRFTNNFVSDSANQVIHKRFNSYYMESDKYADVTYMATIENATEINFEKDGNYPIRTSGMLRIHGVDRKVAAQGIVSVQGTEVTVAAKIMVQPLDYGIRIPAYIGNMYFKEVFIETKANLKRKP